MAWKMWLFGALAANLLVCAHAPRGVNPYAGNPDAVEEGRGFYILYGCIGCHGKLGGGRMGPSIVDDEWSFGSDDMMLFRLMRGQVAGQTMPSPWGEDLTDERVWKVLAYVRSLHRGDAE